MTCNFCHLLSAYARSSLRVVFWQQSLIVRILICRGHFFAEESYKLCLFLQKMSCSLCYVLSALCCSYCGYIYTHVSIYMYFFIHIYIHTYVYMYKYIYIYIYAFTCMCLCILRSRPFDRFLQKRYLQKDREHKYMKTYIYVYVYIYRYVYTYIYGQFTTRQY